MAWPLQICASATANCPPQTTLLIWFTRGVSYIMRPIQSSPCARSLAYCGRAALPKLWSTTVILSKRFIVGFAMHYSEGDRGSRFRMFSISTWRASGQKRIRARNSLSWRASADLQLTRSILRPRPFTIYLSVTLFRRASAQKSSPAYSGAINAAGSSAP